MVTFIAQKPSFSSIMMYISGKKSFVKPRLILGKFWPGSGQGLEFWPGPGITASKVHPLNTGQLSLLVVHGAKVHHINTGYCIQDTLSSRALYTRYPIVARALGLAAASKGILHTIARRAWPSASREQRYLAYNTG